MADRDAKVRLNLSAAGFLTQLEQIRRGAKELEDAVAGIGDGADKASRKSSTLFGVLKTGAGGARSELSQLGGQLKAVLTQAATLGGALSIGAGITEAREATKSYKDLAFAIRRGSDASMTWQQVQQDVEASAGKWKRGNREIRESYEGIYQETGNLAFTKAAIDSVGMAATATGKRTEIWSNIAGTLNEKFGIGAGGINSAMATVVELTNKGGISAEELSEKLGLAGASAKFLGLQGQSGLERILAMLNMADDSLGTTKQKFGAVQNVLDQMADPGRLKDIEKALGVKLTDSKGNARNDAIERIIAKTKGQESELRKAFGANEVKLVASLAKPFVEAFGAAEGNVKQKTAAAIDAYHRSLDAAGKANYSAADLQKDATERLGDSDRNLQVALNDFVKAFERPEMVHAIDQVAAAAPKLAKSLGDGIEWATKHPLGAAGAVVGGVAAKGAVSAIVTKVSESAMESAGKLLGKGMESSWSAGGKLAGASFVLAAGAAGYEIGKLLADYLLDRDKAKKEAAEGAASTAEAMAKHGTGTAEERKAAASDLRSKISEMEKDKGPGFFTDLVGSWGAKFAGDDTLNPQVEFQKRLANMKQQLAALEGGSAPAGLAAVAAPAGVPSVATSGLVGPSAEAQKLAGEVVNGDGSRKVQITNEQAFAAAVARQLGSTTLRVVVAGGGSGTNGLSPAPGNDSGSTPR